MIFSRLQHLLHEVLGRLERGDVTRLEHHGCVLGNVTGGLLGTVLDAEGAEAAQVDGLFVLCKTDADSLHESLDGGGHILLGDTRLLGDLIDDFCLCHLVVLSIY